MRSGLVAVVIAVVALLLVAAATSVGFRRTSLPYTVGLVLVGLGLGILTDTFPQLEWLRAARLSPELILFIFLPTLIFESAFNLDSRLLSRNLVPVMVLAAPGLLLSTAVVGTLMAWLTPLGLGAALLFGALISATDPVAVIALFKEIGAPKRLAILVEGESLFNDATAIVLFRIILGVMAGGALGIATVAGGAVEFAYVFLGGLVVGALIGYLMVRSIALADDDPLVQVALSTVVAYAAFIAADHYLHVSGVMATLGAGVVVGTLGSTRFSRDVRSYLHQFWEFAAFVANSLIFLLVGLSVSLGDLATHLGPIGWAIVAVLLSRAVTVFGLVPLVGRLPGAEPIDGRHQSVLFWGGLRGGVALALALSLPPDLAQRDLIVALAVAVVLFTLLVGGPTMQPLMRFLGLDRPTLVERVARAQADVAAKREALHRVRRLASAGHFSSHLTLQVEGERQASLDAASTSLDVLRQELSPPEMSLALRSEAVAVERTVYRELFDRGMMSEPVLRELELGVDLAQDALRRGAIPDGGTAPTPVEVRTLDGLMRVIEWLAPRSRLVQRHRLRGLAASYEHDMAVHEASRRVADQIAELAELTGAATALAAECRATYQRRAALALQRLDSVAEHFPEYVQAVQRQTALRIALDGEADAVNRLVAVGAVPDSIARSSRRSVTRAQRDLMRQPVAALTLEPRELLARVPLLAGVEAAHVDRIATALVPRTALNGQTIIRQGERGTSLFLIARGVVAVLMAREGGEPARVASLAAGEFFGEMALLTAEPRSATVRAVTDCQLYELSKRDVDALCQEYPRLRAALLEAYRTRRPGAPTPS